MKTARSDAPSDEGRKQRAGSVLIMSGLPRCVNPFVRQVGRPGAVVTLAAPGAARPVPRATPSFSNGDRSPAAGVLMS